MNLNICFSKITFGTIAKEKKNRGAHICYGLLSVFIQLSIVQNLLLNHQLGIFWASQIIHHIIKI